MGNNVVLTVKKSEMVWTVILSRPDSRNAMYLTCSNELHQTFVECDKEESVWAAVLSGDNG